MLDDINKVKWNKFRTAHGDASAVPDAIRRLISANPTEQEAAYWKLDNHVVLQSELYDSAPHVVPFLLEILSSKTSYGRGYVYDLLYEISNGCAAKEEMVEIDGEKLPLVDACRKATLSGMEIYFNELSDSSSSYRFKVLELISSFATEKKIMVPKLKQLVKTEKSLELRQQLQQAIDKLN